MVSVAAECLAKTSFVCWISRWGCLSTKACQVILKLVDKGSSCLCFCQKIKSPLYNCKLCHIPESDTVVSRYSSFEEYENYLRKKSDFPSAISCVDSGCTGHSQQVWKAAIWALSKSWGHHDLIPLLESDYNSPWNFSDSVWEVSAIPQLLLGRKKFHIFLERKN